MSITLNTVVYTFNGFLNRISQYFNAATGVPNGFRRLSASVDEPSKEGKSYKVRWKLKLPAVIDGESCACPDGLVQDNFADIVITVSRASTTAQRTDIALQVKDLCASTAFQSSVINLLPPSA